MIRLLALSTLLLLAGPSTDPQAPPPEAQVMPAEIANARIEEALGDGLDTEDREKTLREVMTRCEDPALVSLAAYNLGTVLIEQGTPDAQRLNDAIDALRVADRSGVGPRVRANARFNVGHARYQLAHLGDNQPDDQHGAQTREPDLQDRIDTLKDKVSMLIPAAGAFRSVIDIDPGNTEAAENVESVRREIKQLRDEIHKLEQALDQQQEQQRQEQKQRQQQQQQAADELDKLAQQQQEQANKTADSPPHDQQGQQEQQQNQERISDQTQSAREQIENRQPSQSEQMDQVKQKLAEARDAQKRAQEAMERDDQQQTAEEQQRAADSLKDAAELMQQIADQTKQENEQQGQQPGEGREDEQGQGGDTQPQQSQTADKSQRDKINEIAKQLLDKERRERDARDAFVPVGRPTKVDKDW